MLSISKILVPTDFSECAKKALTKAVQLAKYHSAELHVIHVTLLPTPDPYTMSYYFPDMEGIKEKVQATIHEQLEKIESGIEDTISVKLVYDSGYNVALSLEMYASEHDIDLIVEGTHGHTGIERKFLGSTSEEILKRVPCPVMTVHYNSDPSKEIKRICVPIDFSDESKHSIKVAVEFAKKWGACLQILHVIVQPKDLQHLYIHIHISDDAVDKSTALIKEFIKDIVSDDINYEISVKIKPSTHYISEFCETNKSDLIIMATHGFSGLKKFFLGTTAETVVRSTELPVLILKN